MGYRILSMRSRSSLGLVSVLILAGGCVSSMSRKDAARARDPKTGVIRGAEAFLLPGSGPDAALLVHGFMSAPSEMRALGERLNRAGLTVSGIRLRGHGTTPKELRRAKWPQWYAEVEREYDRLRAGHRKVHVVGFSLGGLLASRLAAEKPLDSLVLLAPAFRITYKWWYVLPAEAHLQLLGRLAPYLPRLEGWVMLNDRTHIDEWIAYHRFPPAGARQLAALARRVRKEAPRLSSRLLLIHSKRDELASPRAARKFFARAGSKEKKVIWLERSNHIITLDYEREAVFSAVETFLRPGPRPTGSAGPAGARDP